MKILALLFLAQISLSICAQQTIKVILVPNTEHSVEVSYVRPSNSLEGMRDEGMDKSGRHVSWDFFDGSLIDSVFNRKGELAGVQYVNDSVQYLLKYKENRLSEVCTYLMDEGTREGQWLWFKNEKLEWVQNYESGNLTHSKRIINDKIFSETNYLDHDSRIVKEYFDSGELRMQGQWKGKEMDGVSYLFFKNGKPSYIIEYNEGRFISAITYDEDGQVISNVNNDSADKVWRHCNQEGDICCECREKNGKVKCKPYKPKK